MAERRLWLCARGAPPYELLPGKDVVIGRGGDCDLSLYSSMLSREHAAVRWENGVPVLFDLESLNGTYVGPIRIHRHRLRDGDLVRLGDLNMIYGIADSPPEPPGPVEYPLPDAPEDDDLAPVHETRLFSRNQMLHQRLFSFQELDWLQSQIEGQEERLLDPGLDGSDLSEWAAGVDPDFLWELLRIGVIEPTDHHQDLKGLSQAEVGRACRLSKRGRKLRNRLRGQKAAWNEIAALRYQARQGPLFQGLRLAARAYRPGGGLDELQIERLVYELEMIYAPDVDAPTRILELRRLQTMGVIAPRPGVGEQAWYPAAYEDRLVEISRRGRAMLEGFRLEE